MKFVKFGIFAVALSIFTISCGESSNTEETAEEAVENVEDAAEETMDDVEEATEDAVDATEDAMEEAGDKAEEMTDGHDEAAH